MTDNNNRNNSLSDEALMLSYKLGDYYAFHELYQRHSGKIYGFLQKRVSDTELRNEVFQDTFLKLHRFRSKYDASLPFLPWLFTICRNTLLDHLRKNEREELLLREYEQSAKSDLYATSSGSMSTDILSELSVKEQSTLNMRYIDDLNFYEIGKRLSTSSGNARQMVSRAVRKLRKLFGVIDEQ